MPDLAGEGGSDEGGSSARGGGGGLAIGPRSLRTRKADLRLEKHANLETYSCPKFANYNRGQRCE